MTTYVEYVDDVSDSAEATYLINADVEETPIKRSEPIDIPKSVIDLFASKHVPYITKNYTIRPYKGPLTKHPNDMIFATSNDYIAYKDAWDNRKRTKKYKK